MSVVVNAAQVMAKDLQDALRRVMPAVPKSTPLPILTCVHLSARRRSGTLRVSATDLEMWAHALVATAEDHDDWDVCIPAKALIEATKSKGRLTLSPEGEHDLRVEAGGVSVVLRGIDHNQFPPEPHAPESWGVLWETEDFPRLVKAMGDVARAADTEKGGRPALTGVRVDGKLLLATDGHRVFVHREDRNILSIPQATIPARFATLLARSKARGAVLRVLGERIEEGERYTHLEVDGTDTSVLLQVRLIDGRYPDLFDLLPKTYRASLVVKTNAILPVLNQVASSSSKDDLYAVKLELADSGLLLLTSKSQDNRVEAYLPIESSEGKMPIWFNATLLAEAIAFVEAEIVRLEFSDPLGAARITDGYLTAEYSPRMAYQMPLRLG
jgi:DNA polymerase III sliding clamp (beta) subunit (PCNA family)